MCWNLILKTCFFGADSTRAMAANLSSLEP